MPDHVRPPKLLQQIAPGWLARAIERARAWEAENPELAGRLRANWAER